jgi:hypothetical protein
LLGEVELGSGGCKTQPSLIWIKAVGIEDWDLETVPDVGGFAAANDLVGKSDAEVREAIGDKFPKHIYHSIVCIGALIAHREPDHWAVDAAPIAAGQSVHRSPSAPPAAVLGVRIEAKVSRAA